MQQIILTGFSATGKSTVGRLLADRLGWEFIDTDAEITQGAGKPIAQVFAEEGESAFRRLEQRVLAEVCKRELVIIATGGGAVLLAENQALMNERGLVICLDAPAEIIFQRIISASEDEGQPVRPLLAGDDPLGRIVQLKAERDPLYRLAPIQIDTAGQTCEQVATRVLAALALRGEVPGLAAAPQGARREMMSGMPQAHTAIIGWGTLGTLGAQLRQAGIAGTLFIVSDSTVAALYGEAILTDLRAHGYTAHIWTLPAGEESKTVATLSSLWDWLVSHQAERGDTLVALGGGVVGDLAGFAAATYLRGIALVQAPTTLLALVDSSIGGKTGVNHPQGKNLLGAFYQPRLIVADPAVLLSLPARELSAGWAEVIKYGMIMDAVLFGRLEAHRETLLALEPGGLCEVIAQCIACKAEVVEEDEREGGRRAILNYGHTLGHALEAVTHYSRYLHGEAVSIGMAGEADLAVRLGLLPPEVAARQNRLLQLFGLPIRAPGLVPEALLAAMQHDKKVHRKAIKWILPTAIGTVTQQAVPAELVRETILTLIAPA